ncbi:MAG: sigma-54 dependent transcriptional regulator [Weeksellaceae bacterium]|nr:sigma-54 dependent transcriptional regulator [Weeksellaceae bacterium]
MDKIHSIKQKYGIIGNNPVLNRALERAVQVAPTDISVLVTGESGVGKEFIPKIIHGLSRRKHNNYIAVNCGAIPEGTIDSELFGHEKGAFTGAVGTRKGYFEVADGGTIFLDEVGELPMHTQVRLLRILESGEFMKVGSSEIQKTDVRIVAATNVNVLEAVQNGKFREDLYYRLNTVEIRLPALRERKDDIPLLFRKFALDFAEKYHRPTVRLNEEALQLMANYSWPGNIRQLRNFVEQISVVEEQTDLTAPQISKHIPRNALVPISKNGSAASQQEFHTEREILYKILFDMKKDINDLRSLTLKMMQGKPGDIVKENPELINRVYEQSNLPNLDTVYSYQNPEPTNDFADYNEIEDFEYEDITDIAPSEEVLSLQKNEHELIEKALEKHHGRRKDAAQELGISERTLYRKIKQYGLD